MRFLARARATAPAHWMPSRRARERKARPRAGPFACWGEGRRHGAPASNRLASFAVRSANVAASIRLAALAQKGTSCGQKQCGRQQRAGDLAWQIVKISERRAPCERVNARSARVNGKTGIKRSGFGQMPVARKTSKAGAAVEGAPELGKRRASSRADRANEAAPAQRPQAFRRANRKRAGELMLAPYWRVDACDLIHSPCR